jgi:peptidylprolyl isomerase
MIRSCVTWTSSSDRGWSVKKWGLLALLALLFVSSASTGVEAQEQRKLRHILVANEQVANKLLAAAKSGTDFKAMARRYSLDVGTKILGGDLDWVSPGQMEPEFSRAAFDIPEVGGFATCKTRYGWHVIQFVEIRGAEKPKPPVEPKDTPPAKPDPVSKEEAESEAAKKPLPVDPMADRNEDLGWEVSFSDRTYSPGDEIQFTIRVTNKTDGDLQVLDPRLWPLGMIVRYQFGRMNVPVIFPGDVATADFRNETLAAGAKIQRSFSLKDYLGFEELWPIVRVIWRGDILFNRMKEMKVDTSFIEDAEKTQSRWRFYRSDEANFNQLPLVKSGERWYLCLFSSGRIWIELDPQFYPQLREWIVSAVREGKWDKVKLDVVPDVGIFFGLVDQGKATGVPYGKPVDRSKVAEGITRADFVALPTKLANGSMGFGKRFGLVLDNQARQFNGGLKIGRVVLEEGDPINRIESRERANQESQLTLVLAWPQSLLPDRTIQAIETAAAESPEKELTPEESKPVPAEKPKVVLAPQGTQGSAEKTPKQPQKPSVPEPQKKPEPVSLKPLPTVFMETDNGSFLIRLYEDEAPNTVAHFIHLVENGFYDGKTFHRRVQTGSSKGFIQGGSPDGTSAGTLDYTIKDEPNAKRPAKIYSLVMARHHTRPNSASSQFLIALDDLSYLNGTYTVFGEIISGQKSAIRLAEGSKIKRVTVRSKRDGDYSFEKFAPNQ